jgi:hypothetical protein
MRKVAWYAVDQQLSLARTCLRHPRGPKVRAALEAMLSALWLMGVEP